MSIKIPESLLIESFDLSISLISLAKSHIHFRYALQNHRDLGNAFGASVVDSQVSTKEEQSTIHSPTNTMNQVCL